MRSILRTDVGCVRKTNEDAAYIGDGFYLVCDGMGGHQAGDIASNLTVDILSTALEKQKPSVPLLLSAVMKANDQVFKRSSSKSQFKGMGTTLTAMWVDESEIMIAQVGDSRAYLFREGELLQCTHDHSLVAEMVRLGSLTQEEARVHPKKNLITRSIGTEAKVDVDIFEFERVPKDRWLLCTDGLTNHVTDGEIAHCLSLESLYEAADSLMKMAIERGGTDNITLLIVEDEGGAMV